MSSVPPNLVGPILQAGAAQHNAARALDNERDQQTSATEAGSKRRERQAESVGEADNDTQVFTDSEGTGSQGRAFSDQQEESPTEEIKPKNGISRDQDGQMHVDLEA